MKPEFVQPILLLLQILCLILYIINKDDKYFISGVVIMVGILVITALKT